jgi:DNA-binding transcriptional ArsR family regulator
MIRYRFTHDDLLRTRFALSPLFDLVWSTAALRTPADHAVHRPWIRAARERLRGLDWALLDAVANPDGTYNPDFPSPPPAMPVADLEGELARVRATPPERVVQEVRWAYEGREMPEVLGPLLDDPERGLHRLVDVMAAYWERAIAPWWPAIRTALEADVVHRARRLAAGGTIEVFAGLNHQVRWNEGTLEVDRRADDEVDLRGRGLLLIPAAFAWPEAFAMVDEPWQPTLIYTPRGIGSLWAPRAGQDDAALDALLGRRRAAILRALATPLSTTDLATRLGASPGGVSEHLAVLREAGLLTADRDGRHVLYRRTAAGETLLRAPRR